MDILYWKDTCMHTCTRCNPHQNRIIIIKNQQCRQWTAYAQIHALPMKWKQKQNGNNQSKNKTKQRDEKKNIHKMDRKNKTETHIEQEWKNK